MILSKKGKKRKSSFLFVILFIPLQVYTQQVDLFDEQNVASYADYLFRTNQYSYAAEEFERLLFLNRDNIDYQLKLLKSYRFSGEFDKGIRAYENLITPFNTSHLDLTVEYSKLNLLNMDLARNNDILLNKDLDLVFRSNLDLTMRLLSYPSYNGNLEGIDVALVDKGLMNLYNSHADIRYRSRFLAGSMSVVIPGMGKVYAGRWKDGLISLLFVGATGFQAYRAFSQKGIQSVYGWIMGTLSFGFYIGNIYGSSKAARLYNLNQNNSYSEKVTDYYINHY